MTNIVLFVERKNNFVWKLFIKKKHPCCCDNIIGYWQGLYNYCKQTHLATRDVCGRGLIIKMPKSGHFIGYITMGTLFVKETSAE